ncbi:MAG: hypothetical protein ACK54C_02155 [Betaproteobacteria bacterium]
MPILTSEIEARFSGGAGNSNPLLSIGGVKSSVQVTAALFDDVDSAESAAGDTEYRCVYIHNANGTLTLQNPVIWLTAESPNYIDIGVGASAVNATETAVANENTAPAGVSFSSPGNKGAGLALGNIPPGQHKAVWVRRTIPAAAGAAAGSFSFRVEGDTLP